MRDFRLTTARFYRFIAHTALLAGFAGSAGAAEMMTMRDARREPQPQVVNSERDGLFEMGPVKLHPRAVATVTYDDNIFIDNKNKEDDVIWAFSPGITLGIGQHPTMTNRKGVGSYFSLDYAPTFIVFQENSDQNAVEHDLELLGQLSFSKSTLSLRQGFQSLSGSQADIGDRVNRDIYSTNLKAHYDATEKTFFDLGATYQLRDYERQFDSEEWTVEGFVGYRVRPKVSLSLGGMHGWLYSDGQGDQTYQQILARLTYDVSGKVDLYAQAGYELRQYEESGGDDSGFVFDIGATWRPFDGTTFNLTAYRQDQSSAIVGGANYLSTGVAASIRQRFFHRLFTTVTTGYELSEYHSTVSGLDTDREDDYWFVRGQLDMNLTRRWAVGAFAQHRENNSSDESFGFDNNQFGLQSSIRF